MQEEVVLEYHNCRGLETPGIVAFSSSAQQHRGGCIGGGECLDRSKVGNRPDRAGREGLVAWFTSGGVEKGFNLTNPSRTGREAETGDWWGARAGEFRINEAEDLV